MYEATRAFLTSLQHSAQTAEPLASAIADSSHDLLKLASRGVAWSIHLRHRAVIPAATGNSASELLRQPISSQCLMGQDFVEQQSHMADVQHKVSQSARSFLTVTRKKQFNLTKQKTKVKFVPTEITAPTKYTKPIKEAMPPIKEAIKIKPQIMEATKGLANAAKQQNPNQGQGSNRGTGQGAKQFSKATNVNIDSHNVHFLAGCMGQVDGDHFCIRRDLLVGNHLTHFLDYWK